MSTQMPGIDYGQAAERRRHTTPANDRDNRRLLAGPGPVPMSSLAKPMLLSQLLACVVPACLAVYWLVFPSNQDLANLFFRPAILATCIMISLLWYRLLVTGAEKKLAGVLALLCAVLLVPSLAATDPVRALREWLKLFIICTVSFLLCRALRHARTAKILGSSLMIASAVDSALIVATYVKYSGLVLPTYTATRAFKGEILKGGLPLNAIAFECVFAYISGMCLLRGTKLLWSLGLVLLVISSVVSGSRAPLAVSGVSALVLIVTNALRSRRLLVGVAGLILAAAIVLGATVAIATFTLEDTFTPEEMSAATDGEGRWDLWSVAFQKFTERPILGYGYLSSQDDLGYIPGGYHNEYLTALAEQGVVGFVAVMSLFWFLLRCCWNLAFRPSYTCAWQNGQWALFGCLFLLSRGVVELPGLFGSAQGPADFLAYTFLAIVVSRISREEDYMLEMRRPVRCPARSCARALSREISQVRLG
jgi:O-antigen ligase